MSHFAVVPARPGYITVLNLDNVLTLGDDVIAWRIETEVGDLESQSYCVPITVNGGNESSCVGVRNPDRTVTIHADQTYASLADAQASIT